MSQGMYSGISEQSKASKHRLDDAQALFNTVRWRGAMYMAGYAVECLLKTKLMQMYNCRNLHELEQELQRRDLVGSRVTVFTHQLELLLRLTKGFDRLRQNQLYWQYFNSVNRWMPAWRYTADLSNRRDATDFLEAVENILQWIENNI